MWFHALRLLGYKACSAYSLQAPGPRVLNECLATQVAVMLELGDPDQLLTYNCEHLAFRHTGLDDSRGLGTVGLWIKEIASSHLGKRTKVGRVRLAESQTDHSWAVPGCAELHISEEMSSLVTTCHELAHLIGSPRHDPRFRRANIELIRLVGGESPAARLQGAYRGAGLAVASIQNWEPKSVRPLWRMDVAAVLTLAVTVLAIFVWS